MTDRGTPTPMDVAKAGSMGRGSLAKYDLIRWQQGLRGGRFIAEGLGISVDREGNAQAELIFFSPDLGLQRAPIAIKRLGEGDTVYRKSNGEG
ncbi:MAG: hypothetical protein HYW63_00400 [Candidatus Levybacteria bacterium]|nr:hypothetical protein [Candidatus Levybacteria bacterium]